MNAYLFTYKHLSDETDATYYCWKIAKDERTAFQFAFGKSKRKDQDHISTKRGLRIHLLSTEEHDVSKIFPISKLQREESSEGVSSDADFML
tara:strand:- start:1341 stop:1616 length:276 start_codon:yes stop_codon:yes gene_type:complete